MKRLILIIWILFTFTTLAQKPLIIDHTCIDLSEIPINWIDSAKMKLFIGYGHTSHGSQITSGMDAIESFYTDGTYDWSHDGGENELHLFEGDGYGTGDLDHDVGYSGWVAETRGYLGRTPDCNVIIWSWCGQVNDVDLPSHYLNPMNQLEQDFPNVTFVYMTGHLEGLGLNGTLYHANQQIRDYCKNNNKILFDFTDIEKYSPDGNINYQQYYVTDGCVYNKPTGGTGNWANEWLNANPDHTLSKISQYCSSCAHSVSLNCVKKGVAAWYLWARIAGWEGNTSGYQTLEYKNQLKAYPNPVKDELTIILPEKAEEIQITVYNLSGKIVYRSIDNSNQKKVSIAFTNLSSGIYLLQLNTGANIYNHKISKTTF